MSKNGLNIGRGGSMEVKAPKSGNTEANKKPNKQTGGDLRAASSSAKKKGGK